MSYGARIKGLETAVKRMEAAAGKGRRCAGCRLTLRRSWHDPKKPKPRPENVINVKCEFCHSEYNVNLPGDSKVEREATRLYYSFTLEDQYANPKAHALLEWWRHRPGLNKKAERRAPPRVKDDPGSRALVKLRGERLKLHARKHKALWAKYGETPFPEQLELIESVKNRQRSKRPGGDYVRGLFELEFAEMNHMICAELEKIIWGRTSPETEEAIRKLGRDIDELIVKRREAAEREKEEMRLNNLAFLNKNRASSGMPPLPDDYGK